MRQTRRAPTRDAPTPAHAPPRSPQTAYPPKLCKGLLVGALRNPWHTSRTPRSTLTLALSPCRERGSGPRQGLHWIPASAGMTGLRAQGCEVPASAGTTGQGAPNPAHAPLRSPPTAYPPKLCKGLLVGTLRNLMAHPARPAAVPSPPAPLPEGEGGQAMRQGLHWIPAFAGMTSPVSRWRRWPP